MVNYDIPWNPARLEQRMGRIHRYGQKRDPMIIVNLIAGKTREGRVLQTLLDKLERIRQQLRFDLVATHSDGSRRAIEVKGRAQVGDIEMTGNEWSKACNLLDGYWLYAVFNCATPQPQRYRVRNPLQSLLATAKGGVIIDERRIFAAAEGGAHRA